MENLKCNIENHTNPTGLRTSFSKDNKTVNLLLFDDLNEMLEKVRNEPLPKLSSIKNQSNGVNETEKNIKLKENILESNKESNNESNRAINEQSEISHALLSSGKKENTFPQKKVISTKLNKHVFLRGKYTPSRSTAKKINVNLLPDKKHIENVLKKEVDSKNKVELPNDSFETDFNKLSEETPIKSVSNKNFIIPKMNRVTSLRKNNSINNQNSKSVTPLKVSDMKHSTPLQNNATNRPKVIYSSSKTDIRHNNKQDSLPTIRVNGRVYIMLKLLGQGGSAQVFHCYDMAAKVDRAIKCVTLNVPVTADNNIKEIEVLRRLQSCDKIIKIFDHEIQEHQRKMFVVLELGTADLSKILKDLALNPKPTPFYLILFYWMEMLYAVQQIHSYGIIHSDLKPANFLEVNGKLKLIDFGISCCVQNDMTSVFKTVAEGSLNYISPEALDASNSTNINSPNYGKNKYKLNYKSDVWSLGCILHQLVYKKTPFQHITSVRSKMLAILNCEIVFPTEENVCGKFLNTIKSCLVFDYKDRPSIDQLIEDYEQFS